MMPVGSVLTKWFYLLLSCIVLIVSFRGFVVPLVPGFGSIEVLGRNADFFVSLGVLVYFLAAVGLLVFLASKTIRKSVLEGSPTILGYVSIAVLAAYVFGISAYIVSIYRAGA